MNIKVEGLKCKYQKLETGSEKTERPLRNKGGRETQAWHSNAVHS